jgi:hypothetical protein
MDFNAPRKFSTVGNVTASGPNNLSCKDGDIVNLDLFKAYIVLATLSFMCFTASVVGLSRTEDLRDLLLNDRELSSAIRCVFDPSGRSWGLASRPMLKILKLDIKLAGR